ncbi:putative MIP aquaporin (TC 1.A.8) family protein [Lyophyllum shimeji]|uniref:MIP aquaporin (TC 1.A.8) family protein n=1 Tax=Lyophyllum shimeji TaxID=47721 RepID=A0A9P3PMV2_LYOSH|nr:putative MIP aquaporin (TC 1.A.8) family protein [Lyophyllum shimeji]
MTPLSCDGTATRSQRWSDAMRKEKEHTHTEHVEFPDVHDHVTQFPNTWARYRALIREPVAEFLGVCMLIIFGAGVDCQVVLSTNPNVASSPKGSYLSISFGWAIGTAIGVWVSGGISGGHINPAVTLALATYRNFPWKKVPIYIISQVLGGIMGAALVYWDYFHAIDIYEGGPGVRTLKTASLFSTYALDYMTNVSCFFSEFLCTAILMIVVFAMTDKRNCPPPSGLNPLLLFILILGIGACLGMETAYAINPARDLGPRLLTAMVGYGKAVFTYRHQYWLWCPIMAPILGGLAGGAFYDAFLFTGQESIFNKPNAAARQRHLHAASEQRPHAPSGAEAV